MIAAVWQVINIRNLAAAVTSTTPAASAVAAAELGCEMVFRRIRTVLGFGTVCTEEEFLKLIR